MPVSKLSHIFDCIAPGCMNEKLHGSNYCLSHDGEFKQCKMCRRIAISKGLCNKHRPRTRKKCAKITSTGPCTTLAWKGFYCYAHRDKTLCAKFTCHELREPWSEYCISHSKGVKPKITVNRKPEAGYVLKKKSATTCKLKTCFKLRRTKGYCFKHAKDLGLICERQGCVCSKTDHSSFCLKHTDVDRRIID